MRNSKVIIFIFFLFIFCNKEEVWDPWKDPRNITRNKGGSAGASIDIDKGGNVYLVWGDAERVDIYKHEHEIFYKEKINGVWSDIKVLSDSGKDCYKYARDICVDKYGNVHVAYQQVEGVYEGRVYYRMKTKGGNWTEPIDLEGIPQTGGQCVLRTDDNGNIYFFDNGTFIKKVNGVWGEKKSIQDFHWSPDMFVERDGKVHIVGEGSGSVGDNTIHYIYSPDGGETWEGHYLFPQESNHYDWVPAVGVVRSKVYVVWTRSIYGDGMRIMMSVKDTNGVWSEPIEIIGKDRAPHESFIEVEGDYLYLMTNEVIDEQCDIFIRRLNVQTGEWSEARNISNTPLNSRLGSFKILNGVLHCVWNERIGTYDLDIFYDEIEW